VTSSNIVVKMTGITKTFPGVKALDNVDFTLREGEVHAIVGENGAGKTTLIKTLTGVLSADSGEIVLDNRSVHFHNPLDAQLAGISTVYQEVNLCENLSVAENIYIGREPMKRGRIDWKTIYRESAITLRRLNLNIDVAQNLSNYPIAIQQMVAIARALTINAKILILDEPTSSLDEQETEQLFKILRQLRDDGIAIVFISHFLDQIYDICTAVTVLRNGELIGSYQLAELPRVELISKMLGKELGSIEAVAGQRDVRPRGDKFMSLEKVSRIGKVNNLSLDTYSGEVIGLAGLLGSGRTEVAQILSGVEPIDEGRLSIKDKLVRFKSPKDAMDHRVALCPEERKVEGIIGDLTVRENIILALQALDGMFKRMPMKRQEQIADEYIRLLEIKVYDSSQLIKTLSGGNQQKVIISRWLAIHPELMILDEPTRGIDIGTKTQIQQLMIQLAEENGMSVVFISSELEELIRTCSRLLVFRDHYKVGELEEEISSDAIMATIAEGKANG
jgi:monosaccharide-transporting ATPase